MQRKILVDADIFVALNCEHDSSHKKAVLLNNLLSPEVTIMVSDPAFGEAITVISQKAGLDKAIEFAEKVLDSQIDIVEVDAKLRRAALDIFKKQTSKNSRFTDCINMAIMKNEGIGTIFSFDEQYKKNKFKRFEIDKDPEK